MIIEPVWWEWYICPNCGRTAYAPYGVYCQFCQEYLIPMATDKTNAPTTYRRAQEFDQFGASLDSLIGRDVLLTRFSVSERGITDRETKIKDDRTFVSLYVKELDGNGQPEERETVYHAWSEPLANKLAQIPADQLPVLIEFMKVAGAQGNVWSFK